MPQSQGDQHKSTTVLGDFEAGGIALVCAEPEKKLRSNGRTSWNHGRAERASSSPACCRQRNEYPPGYTVFECRLDGNQPIAQVVRVPPDTCDSIEQNETCMILETRQSEFGPRSRVAAYPGRKSSRSATPRPMSFLLETKERPNGATACVGKVAECLDSSTANNEPVTILEADHGRANQDGPSSRLTYGPVGDNGARSSPASYKPPAFFIECTTSPKGPLARVTQVPQGRSRISGDCATRYEAAVKHDGSCPTAKVTRSNKKDDLDVKNGCEYLEARVCSSGPRAKALEFPEQSSNVRHFTHLNVKPRQNGPAARISQHSAGSTRLIDNCHDSRRAMKPAICCCDPRIEPVAQSSRPFAICADDKRILDAVRSAVGRRSCLTPTSSEMEECGGPFKFGRAKNRRICRAPKSCPPTSKAVRACPCPPQPCCKAIEGLRSQMHPLPGGSVFSQCPAPSLPDIAPVQLGPYRLRDYKPLPKKPRPRKKTLPIRGKPVGAKSKPSKPIEPNKLKKPSKPKKLKKPTESDKQEISTESQTKTETKNKKTGPRPKDPKSNESSQEEEKELPQVSRESSVVHPTFASVGNQSDPILREPVYVQCPAQQTESVQTQSIDEEPVYVQCPAYVSQRNKSVQRFEEPTYVRCSAYESKKSSEASTASRATVNTMTSNFSDHLRATAMQKCLACRAKRNGLQDECHFHIPENVMRMSYEQRRNRHARTLVSNPARRRSFMVDQVPEIEYCVRSELPERIAMNGKNRVDSPKDGRRDSIPEVTNEVEQNGRHDKSDKRGSSEKKNKKLGLKAVRSRELRAGVVYYDCDCYHRNGLQQDCPRGGCGGLSHCTTKPWPRCDLSHYFKEKWGKYDDLLDLIPPATYCGPKDALLKSKLGKAEDIKINGNDDKKDTSSKRQGKINGKSEKLAGKKYRSKGPKAEEKQQVIGDEMCDVVHENMVRKYAMIPIVSHD